MPSGEDVYEVATGAGLPPVWICPHCAARLVSRNLWHSCGRFTLEALFANAESGALDLARGYVAMLHLLGDVQVIPQKTRLVCVARVRFGGLQPRKDGFLAAFALHRWLDSPRTIKTADYGQRWRGHFVRVRSEQELDAELGGWLQESHDIVGLQRDLRPSRSRQVLSEAMGSAQQDVAPHGNNDQGEATSVTQRPPGRVATNYLAAPSAPASRDRHSV